MNNKIDNVLNIAMRANSSITKSNLIIPILDNFEIIHQESNTNNQSFVAKYKNVLEQFIVDGKLDENETFEDYIKKVKNSIEDEVSSNELYENKNYLIYYKTYDTPDFQFKIYLQDILSGTKENINFARQIIAYFINSSNEFCQISLASGPYNVNNQKELLDNIQDLDNDEIIKNLDKSLKVIMDNIHYE